MPCCSFFDSFTRPLSQSELCWRGVRVKTSFGKPKQEPLVLVDDWAAGERAGARRQVYLITFPHPQASHSKCGVKLVAPGSMSKTDLLNRVLDACAKPAYMDGHSLSKNLQVHLKQAGVFREYHQPDPVSGDIFTHDHVAALALPKHQFAPMPVKKALLTRHGLASHWSLGICIKNFSINDKVMNLLLF